MARTAQEKQQMLNDYQAAFHAVNPNITYELVVSYRPEGYVEVKQGVYTSKYRPSEILLLTKTLRDRLEKQA